MIVPGEQYYFGVCAILYCRPGTCIHPGILTESRLVMFSYVPSGIKTPINTRTYLEVLYLVVFS